MSRNNAKNRKTFVASTISTFAKYRRCRRVHYFNETLNNVPALNAHDESDERINEILNQRKYDANAFVTLSLVIFSCGEHKFAINHHAYIAVGGGVSKYNKMHYHVC